MMGRMRRHAGGQIGDVNIHLDAAVVLAVEEVPGAVFAAGLGGQVFDVLGKMQFEGKALRELLLEAIRYGEQPEVKSRLHQVVENVFVRPGAGDAQNSRKRAEQQQDVDELVRRGDCV